MAWNKRARIWLKRAKTPFLEWLSSVSAGEWDRAGEIERGSRTRGVPSRGCNYSLLWWGKSAKGLSRMIRGWLSVGSQPFHVECYRLVKRNEEVEQPGTVGRVNWIWEFKKAVLRRCRIHLGQFNEQYLEGETISSDKNLLTTELVYQFIDLNPA